jgi:hypothetical protein
MSMKHLFPFICKVMAGVMIASCIGCEAPDGGHHKKKVVTAEEFDASNGGVSGLPWNRPRSFESGGGMGKMMPQTR